ncbi:MAG: polysulfide reductase NrfD [Magnetococcales bacterium]|nr:polysulfide reductase NrfD [Magnetococcales bacterium]
MFNSRLSYWIWIAGLLLAIAFGVEAYAQQWQRGLAVTGMTDQVLWGLYIGNFVFLVGLAASAVVLVIPAYWLQWDEVRQTTLLGECMAIVAVSMSLLFVFVDLGQPVRIWHALPFLGRLNFPVSILAWDMVILTLYLLLNVGLVVYLLWGRYTGQPRLVRRYFFWIVVATLLGIGIHTVTAFMLSGLPARPFWHSALMAPRFIASAFASGAAVLFLMFWVLEKTMGLQRSGQVISLLTGIMTLALLIHLFLLGAEWFVLLYRPTDHGESGRILYWGHSALKLAVWSAIAAEVMVAIVLIIRPLRHHFGVVWVASLLIVGAVLIEKGMGLIVPGFQPTPLGEYVNYLPTTVEIRVTVGIWAFGLLFFTLLARLVVKRREPSQ